MGFGAFFQSVGTGAILGAAAGAAGAAALAKVGYAGYVVAESAKMGAVGGGLIGTLGLFSKSSDGSGPEGTTVTTGIFIGGLLGYAAVNKLAAATVMTLGKTAAAFAVGSFALPLALVLLLVAAGGLCTMCKPAEEEPERRYSFNN